MKTAQVGTEAEEIKEIIEPHNFDEKMDALQRSETAGEYPIPLQTLWFSS